MPIKIVNLPFSARAHGFDDSPLQLFLRGRELLALREHLFEVSGVPYLTCILNYQEASATSEVPFETEKQPEAPRQRAKSAAQLGEELPAAQRVLFDSLRAWRSSKAEKEGVPSYVILTNRQLLEITRQRPEHLTALGRIEGIGKAKLKRHGKQILELLACSETTSPVENEAEVIEADKPKAEEA